VLQARIRRPSQGGHSSPKPASHMDSDGAPRTRCGPNLRRGLFHITGLPLVHVMMTAVNMSYNLRMIENWRRRNLEADRPRAVLPADHPLLVDDTKIAGYRAVTHAEEYGGHAA
jgi:hypothetical protein